MEGRKNIMLGTAGHVDHGKTALVKLLTGCDTDRLPEEKRRGLTIELGFAPCRMADQRIVGVVDVPGHVDFIRNMVAGAHGVDVVILVVAADDGVMPQTREHLDILTLMGTRHGVVALTKIDLIDQEMRQLVLDDVRAFLAGTFLEGADVCPVSNITGEGFEGFFAALNRQVEACRPREATGLFRLWIERTFPMHGFGLVVSGIPTSGQVRVGDRLRLLPDGLTGRIRRMEVYGQEADVARAGECVAMNLAEIDPAVLRRGKVLCQGDVFEPVTMVEVDLVLLPTLPQPLKDYAEVHLHVGTAECMANVALLEGKQAPPGGTALAQLRLREPLGLAPGERFVIRGGMAGLAGGRTTTLGGGRVLGTGNVRLRRNRPWTLAMLAARRQAVDDPAAWCALHLKESAAALAPESLARRAQLPLEQVQEILKALQAAGQIAAVGGGTAFVHSQTLKDLRERIAAALAEFHAANPLRVGVEEEQLLAGLRADSKALELAVAELIREGVASRQGTVLALRGRSAQLSPEDRELCERIERRLAEGHLAPPSPTELAEALGRPEEKVHQILRLLIDQGVAVELDPKLVMHAAAVQAGKDAALALFRKASGFETVEFRDAVGVSRKYAVPLLDYLDRARFTVRSGSRRTPGAEARRLL